MMMWYLLSAPAWVILILTATARLADMGRADWAPIDHARRIGYIGAATAFFSMLVTPFASDGWEFARTSWRGALIAWSWAIIAIATPGMPPWWDFILGVHRRTDLWRNLSPWGRLVAELRALRDSFKPRRMRKPPLAGPQGKLP